MNTDEVVKKLNNICLGYTDILGMMILFGSYARKEATAQSDIDLYIEPRDINVTTSRFGTSRRYRKFKYDLYNQFPVEFDLIAYGGKKDLAAVKNSPLWKRIEKEGILIYDKRKTEGHNTAMECDYATIKGAAVEELITIRDQIASHFPPYFDPEQDVLTALDEKYGSVD